MRRSNYIFPLLAGLLIMQSASGQQNNMPEIIRQKLKDYCKAVPREEIFVHTDREQYLPGEDLWFNVYLIDRQSLKPSILSKLTYVEILNPDNKPVVQKRILLDNGFGPGQVVLPDTLGPGTYTLRAYTNWMRNFLPDNCFQKEIDVFDPLTARQFIRTERAGQKDNFTPGLPPPGSVFKIEVNTRRKDSLEIIIRPDTESENLLYLLIQTRGITDHLSIEEITGGIKRIVIPVDSLTPGINQVVLFDSGGPVSEAYFYTPPKVKKDLIVNIPGSCGKREKVSLEINAGDGSSDNTELSNLSVSVASGTDNQEITDIYDYLIFGTEYGFLPRDIIGRKSLADLPSGTIDSLLSNIKSNWIDWRKVFSEKDQKYKYQPENEEHYLYGQLLTDKLVPVYAGEILLMSTPGKVADFQYTETDQDGNFSFRTVIDNKTRELILQPDLGAKGRKIYISSSFSEKYIPVKKIKHIAGKTEYPNLLHQSITSQVRKIFGSSAAGSPVPPAPEKFPRLRFYGKPDFELKLNNFVTLDSMQEVFFELVPRVAFETAGSVYTMSVYDPLRNKLDGSPVVMIDGVIIKDLLLIAEMDPGIVEKIDVVWDNYRVGNYIFNGLVNIITKTGDFSNGVLSADAVRLHYSVADTVHSFVSPDYSSPDIRNSHLPDYRNTLYWNPAVHTDENGNCRVEFWSGDNKSDYVISIAGITPSGRFVSIKRNIKVR